MKPKPIELELPNGLTLRGLEWGSHHSKLILALHGWLDNANSFYLLAPRLSEHYRIVALDLAGHGQSDHRPKGVRYHLLDNVDDILWAIDELTNDPVILLGHSMGAGISSYVAAVEPQAVNALILLEGLGSQASPESEALTTLRSAVRDMKRINRLRKPPIYPSLEDAARARADGLFQLPYDAAMALTERGSRQFEGMIALSSDHRLKMTSAMRLTEPMVKAILQGISAPTLLLGAQQGYFARFSELRERAEQVADISIKSFPGGHHFHMEHEVVTMISAEILHFLGNL